MGRKRWAENGGQGGGHAKAMPRWAAAGSGSGRPLAGRWAVGGTFGARRATLQEAVAGAAAGGLGVALDLLDVGEIAWESQLPEGVARVDRRGLRWQTLAVAWESVVRVSHPPVTHSSGEGLGGLLSAGLGAIVGREPCVVRFELRSGDSVSLDVQSFHPPARLLAEIAARSPVPVEELSGAAGGSGRIPRDGPSR